MASNDTEGHVAGDEVLMRGHLVGSVSTGLVRAAGRPVVLVSASAAKPGTGEG